MNTKTPSNQQQQQQQGPRLPRVHPSVVEVSFGLKHLLDSVPLSTADRDRANNNLHSLVVHIEQLSDALNEANAEIRLLKQPAPEPAGTCPPPANVVPVNP